MKASELLLIGAGAVVAGYLLLRYLDPGKYARGEVGEPGNPYYGAGIPGTLGYYTNELLGGYPQQAGEAIGSSLYAIVHGFDSPGDN